MAEELNQNLIYFNEQKKIMEDKQINYLLNYVRSGKLLQAEGSYMTVYNIVYNLVDRRLGEESLKYHNEKIEQAVIECYEKIKNLSGIDFIDSFILYTKRINFFIYNMSRLFIYITNNHLKSVEENLGRKYKENDISEFSMYIYKKCFFDKLQVKLYQILNELLIRDERNSNNENRDKILFIMEIINSMDIIKPKIAKKGENEFMWIETLHKEELSYEYKLFSIYPGSLTLIQKSFRSYISERLKALKNDEELFKDKKRFIEALINLKTEMDEFVTKCFKNDLIFIIAEKEEFCDIMKEISPEILKDYEGFCKEIGFIVNK
jgi:hypothetical protein